MIDDLTAQTNQTPPLADKPAVNPPPDQPLTPTPPANPVIDQPIVDPMAPPVPSTDGPPPRPEDDGPLAQIPPAPPTPGNDDPIPPKPDSPIVKTESPEINQPAKFSAVKKSNVVKIGGAILGIFLLVGGLIGANYLVKQSAEPRSQAADTQEECEAQGHTWCGSGECPDDWSFGPGCWSGGGSDPCGDRKKEACESHQEKKDDRAELEAECRDKCTSNKKCTGNNWRPDKDEFETEGCECAPGSHQHWANEWYGNCDCDGGYEWNGSKCVEDEDNPPTEGCEVNWSRSSKTYQGVKISNACLTVKTTNCVGEIVGFTRYHCPGGIPGTGGGCLENKRGPIEETIGSYSFEKTMCIDDFGGLPGVPNICPPGQIDAAVGNPNISHDSMMWDIPEDLCPSGKEDIGYICAALQAEENSDGSMTLTCIGTTSNTQFTTSEFQYTTNGGSTWQSLGSPTPEVFKTDMNLKTYSSSLTIPAETVPDDAWATRCNFCVDSSNCTPWGTHE